MTDHAQDPDQPPAPSPSPATKARRGVQQAKGGRCDCGVSTYVTPTDSPWEFDWRCPGCGATGIISWSHANPPPEFVGQVIDR